MADRRPLDTSTLGPVRYDPASVVAQAQRVREAIRAAAADEDDKPAREAMEVVARWAQPATLIKLGQLLK